MDLAPHHRRAIERLVSALEPDQANRALLLAGSLAHGYARPDSDVDVLLVRDHMSPAQGEHERGLTWTDPSFCDWQGGYVDAKQVDLEHIRQVAARGSEPARFAYQGARILFDRTDGLEGLLARVVRYPIEGRDQRVDRFVAQLVAARWFHGEALRRDDPYLATFARQRVVLFACRIVLARNEQLYPFHKWLLREVERATDRPPTVLEDVDRLLREPSQARLEGLVSMVLQHYRIDETAANAGWGSRFMQDTELAWTRGEPPVEDL
jgi:hypothetical protein